MSKGFSWTLGAIAAVVGLLATIWGVDAHFTPREVHKIMNEQQDQKFEAVVTQIQQRFIDMNKDRKLEKARDNYWFWVREVETLQKDCMHYPNDAYKRQKLDNAMRERKKAEDYLKELQTN